jgi:hypothetical protein
MIIISAVLARPLVSFFNFFGNIVITGHAIDSLHLNLVVDAGYGIGTYR